MNLEALFGSRTQHPVRLAIVGAGEFGSTAVAQALRCKALELVVVCDRNLERARQAILASGLSEEHFRFCDNRQSAIAALEAHRIALLEDSELIGDLPIEAVIEATGNPEAAAR